MWTGRASFDRALRSLHDEVLVLGSMADKAIERSIEALRRLDQEAAREVIRDDFKINRKRFEIEEQAIELIATQQPMARHLRTIDRATWLLWVAHNLERIADRVSNICERVVYEATGRMEELNVSKY